jgi:SAM-dependent methyltransferase
MSLPLSHPRLKNLSMGDPEWFRAQLSVILTKPLVKSCYDLWYKKLLADADSVPQEALHKPIVELGSGAGYVKTIRPEVIASDVVPGCAEIVLDGRRLPFADGSIRAIFAAHVFHHIPDVERFFEESCRVLAPGGVISMVEVTHTPFARFFFSRIHPEPYNDRAQTWDFPEGHSMLDSNQALSWMVFFRDRRRFVKAFPQLRLESRTYLPWLSYLLSGGVNLRSFVPGFLTPVVRIADTLLKPLDGLFAIHWHLTVRKAVTYDDAATLENEARYLHRMFFKTDAPPEVIERYVAANRVCFPDADPESRRMIDTILERRLDLEAIELVLRLRGRGGVLTKKIQILFYLIEVRSQYYRYFVNQTDAFWPALAAVLFSVVRTVYQLGKGSILVWRVSRCMTW